MVTTIKNNEELMRYKPLINAMWERIRSLRNSSKKGTLQTFEEIIIDCIHEQFNNKQPLITKINIYLELLNRFSNHSK